MRQRFSAAYIASLGDQPEDSFEPDAVDYVYVTGPVLENVIASARRLDIDDECYNVTREEYQEICPSDGLYDWTAVSDIDPFDLRERFYD